MSDTRPAELTIEAEFAILLRALASHGYRDLLSGHVTVAAGDGTLLVNPFELMWHEVSASDVVRIDADGVKVAGRWSVNPAVALHTTLRRHRPDVVVAVHNHPEWTNVWAGCRRIPAIYDQTSAQIEAPLRLVDEYDGAFDEEYGLGSPVDAVVKLFGDAEWAVLANHGVLVTGRTIAGAFLRAYTLEWRSRRAYQVETLGGGTPIADPIATEFGAAFESVAAPLWWAAECRRQVRLDPGVLS